MVKVRVKVYKNSSNNQKLVTIPKVVDIQPGDYVFIEKVEEEDTNG